MNIFNNFIHSINVLSKFHMTNEDMALTLEKMNYKVNISSFDDLYCNEQVFEDYIESLKIIVEKNDGTIIVESNIDNKKIITSFGDLQIIGDMNFKNKSWNIHIERTQNGETLYYYLGEKGTPFLFLMILLDTNCLNITNFRYSLNKLDENGICLYYNKKEAITHFKDIIFKKGIEIGKIDLSTIETRGEILDKNEKPIAILKNEFETDDIKLAFHISNMNLYLKIYTLLKDDFQNIELLGILTSLGLTLTFQPVMLNLQPFEKIIKYANYMELQSPTNSLAIRNSKNFNIVATPHSIFQTITLFDIQISMLSSGGRKYIILNENLEKIIGKAEKIENNTNLYTFEQVCELIFKFNELTHDSFPYTMFTTIGGDLTSYRYIDFNLALYHNNGFLNLSLKNDYISLDTNAKTGKSYKIGENNQKYDYVVVGKKDTIMKAYSEVFVKNLNANEEVFNQALKNK